MDVLSLNLATGFLTFRIMGMDFTVYASRSLDARMSIRTAQQIVYVGVAYFFG